MNTGFGGARGFGQPGGAGGFSQPATGGFGQPAFGQQSQGGFSQPAQGGAVGGFGQQASGGFGQPSAVGGFAPQGGVIGQVPTGVAGGFGQGGQTGGGFLNQQGLAGGFGQPTGNNFGGGGGGGVGQAAQGAVTGFGQSNANQFGAGGNAFGQQQPGGFAQQGGFGQPASAGGFGQAGTAGGFGQQGGFSQAGRGATGGFGQAGTGFGAQGAATGGFGQQTAGGFGQQTAGGFGQAAAGGFGQPNTAAGGFGQPNAAAGGFGQQGATAGGFAQAGRGATGGFGQAGTGFGAQGAATGGFGQQTAGGFGQAAAGGFGQPNTAAGGFGQPNTAAGGFGQQGATAGGFAQAGRGATGGFGQAGTGFGAQGAATGGFGQQTAGGFGQQTAGGFGQAAAGGFGQPNTAAGGFGQPNAAAGGFGQQGATAGGFAQAGRGATGGFGQAGTGFGAQGAVTGGFGQQTAGGFGQAAAGGFGQPNTAAGGFGQPNTAAGGFGQPNAAAGGFGQPNAAAGGFGQQGAASGFGRGSTGGFGQPGGGGGFGGGFSQPGATAGGFAQPAAAGGAGGFGQAGRGTTGFGAPAGGFGGFGSAGTLGQAAAGATGVPGSIAGAVPNAAQLIHLPDFADKPYGNVLLFAPEDQVKKTGIKAPVSTPVPMPTVSIIPASVTQYQGGLRVSAPAPSSTGNLKQQSASFSTNSLPPVALRDLISAPKLNLGAPDESQTAAIPTSTLALPRQSILSTSDAVVTTTGAMSSGDAAVATEHAPVCSNPDYILDPPLQVLQDLSIQQLQSLPDLRIYRRDGKCNVEFLEPVNLVRCDISDAVSLRENGEVIFYPGASVLPPYGRGLHVLARVTVNGVTGVTALELRHRCRKEGLIFNSYDPQTETWVYTANSGDVEEEGSLYEQEIEQNSVYDESDGIQTPVQSDPMNPFAHPHPHQLMVLSPSRSAPPVSLARPAARTEHSTILPTRHGEVSVRMQAAFPIASEEASLEDFELPYKLPDTSKEKVLCERKEALVIREKRVETRLPVYVVKKADSKMYEMNAAGDSRNAMVALGRSFRVGWGIGGRIAIPTYACLRDGTEYRQEVEEVHGAHLSIVNPFFAHTTGNNYLQRCAISVLRTACRNLGLVEASGDNMNHYPLLTVNLCREKSNVSLSSEKLQELIMAIDTTRNERPSAVAASTARQVKTLLNLFDAIYALPEADEAEPNALTESHYLTQLRRRNLNTWLKNELAFMDSWTDEDLSTNSAQKLLHKLLCHKLDDAVSIAKMTGNTELSRVLCVCGDGNQFGGYITTADTTQLDAEPSVRDRVVSLLAGIVEPFISQPRYETSCSGDVVGPIPLTATWKQLLGIFAFYGCTPDTSAGDIIEAFLERLRKPASRRENAFPPYAESIDRNMLRTNRGRDFLSRGNEFQDSALSVLEGFAMGRVPATSALHPHASSYCATDYLAPFIILLAMRSIKLPRTESYKDAETKVLLGFAAQLECLEDSWFWSLLPLHMIEDLHCRTTAVRGCLMRNALRFTESDRGKSTELKHIAVLTNLNMTLLEPCRPPEVDLIEVPANAPSIRTHASLQEALNSFSRDFAKK